jgi:hypothetical protein
VVDGGGGRRGALVNVGEVRSGRNLGGKTWGGGAHREAEVAAMVAPKQAECVASDARDGTRDLAARAGRVTVLELGRRARKGGQWGGGRRL